MEFEEIRAKMIIIYYASLFNNICHSIDKKCRNAKNRRLMDKFAVFL